MERSTRRLIVASLVAPLATPLLYWLGLVAGMVADPGKRNSLPESALTLLPLVFYAAAPTAYAATVAALGLLWLVRRFGALTFYRTGLVGALVGTLTAAILQPGLRGELFSIPLPPWVGALLGAASAALWWWLAIRKAP